MFGLIYASILHLHCYFYPSTVLPELETNKDKNKQKENVSEMIDSERLLVSHTVFI